jgi:hypothetical protein
MARVIVEQVYAEPMTDEALAAFAKRIDPCLEVRSGTWRRSAVSSDRRRMTCEFEAPDAESVREAYGVAGLPYERIWSADVFAVEDYPELMAKLTALQDRQKAGS